MFHVRQIPNLSRPSTLFPNQFKDFFRFSEIQGLFKACLELKASAETLLDTCKAPVRSPQSE